MPFAYAKYSPELSEAALRFDDIARDQSILYFDARREHFAEAIGDRYRKLDPTIRRADLVLFRGHGQQFLDDISADVLLPGLLGDTPALALVGTATMPSKVQLYEIPSLQSGICTLDIPTLCSLELKATLRSYGALYGLDGNMHFELPSGHHSSGFIRVGDALNDDIQVSRLGDWVFPLLPRGCCLVLDTGTLLALAQHLRLLALTQWGADLPIRMVDRYPTNVTAFNRRVNDLIRQFGSGVPIVFLVSVSSSGHFLNLIEQARCKSTAIVLYETSGRQYPNTTTLCNESLERWSAGSNGKCSMCHSLPIVRIDPRSYQLQVGFKRIRHPLTKHVASKHKPLWESLNKSKSIRLHHDLTIGDKSIRHYGIYIDVAAALNERWFYETVKEKLQQLPVPNIVFIPNHVGSDALRLLSIDVFGKIDIRITHNPISDQSLLAELRTLTSTSRVLILDDALVEGNTLFQLRQQLYKITQNDQPKIYAFVVLARPKTIAEVKRIKDRFLHPEDGSLFSFAFSVILPPVGRDSCPWCREHELLEVHLSKVPRWLIQTAQSRLSQLAFPFQGYPAIDSSAHISTDKMETSGSVFGKLSPITAFTAASVAVRELLDNANIETKDKPHVINVADVPYMLNNYYDACLVSGFLRSVDAISVIDPSQRSEVHDILMKLGNKSDPALLWEICIAVLDGKLQKDMMHSLFTAGDHNNHAILLGGFLLQ